jgi:AcrR family transcriptional regulator
MGNGAGSGRARRKREAELLDAAAEIFHRQGYAETTVREVADALGILKGSLYHYIDSKEDLLFRLMEETTRNAQVMIEAARQQGGAPLERIWAYFRRHVEFNAQNFARVSVYYHDFHLLTPERRHELARQRREHERFVVDLIAGAQADGSVPDFDPDLAAKCCFGVANWMYRWYRPGQVEVDALSRFVADFVVGGLAGEPERLLAAASADGFKNQPIDRLL